MGKDLKTKVLEVLKNTDKEKLKNANYKEGFEDCLKIICQIFNIKKIKISV